MTFLCPLLGALDICAILVSTKYISGRCREGGSMGRWGCRNVRYGGGYGGGMWGCKRRGRVRRYGAAGLLVRRRGVG